MKKAPQSNLWLITFVDMISLLLAFFIMLLSMSGLEQKDWNRFVHGLNTFHNSGTASDGAGKGLKDILPSHIAPEPGDLDYLEPLFKQLFQKTPGLKDLKLQRSPGQLRIECPSHLLFATGQSTLNPMAESILYELSHILKTIKNPLAIAGHTDPESIATTDFQSNEELSIARALNVAALLKKMGVSQSFTIYGYGDRLFSELDPSLNLMQRYQQARRVDIIILETP